MADETITAAAETEEEREAREMISFGIIASAGQARSLAFESLKAARAGDFETAERLLSESRSAALEAHHQQTNLLSKEAAGEHTPVDVMLVHAQDHLMTAMLAQELIGELVNLYKVKADREE
ncbi:PTS lactose/cellobiose transporter subunit IIA [Collinsella sp. An2]|nr:PTS lactose/cellobiose transporter subunit IIA [Collinsella sp. An2]